MTRDEARALNNMSPLPNEEGKGVIVPLNVLVGGQASPRDSVADAYKSVKNTCSCDHAHVKEVENIEPSTVTIDSEPTEEEKDKIAEVLDNFFKRQEKSVLSKLGVKAQNTYWWDVDRWNRELADDLFGTVFAMATSKGKLIAKKLDSEYKEGITNKYLRKYVENQSKLINDVTYDKLDYVENNAEFLQSEENTSEEPRNAIIS